MIFIGLLLIVALLVSMVSLFVLTFKQQKKIEHLQQVQYKTDALEANLKQTLEITQDLVRKMHVQQQALDLSTQKILQVELQNAELVKLVMQVVQR